MIYTPTIRYLLVIITREMLSNFRYIHLAHTELRVGSQIIGLQATRAIASEGDGPLSNEFFVIQAAGLDLHRTITI